MFYTSAVCTYWGVILISIPIRKIDGILPLTTGVTHELEQPRSMLCMQITALSWKRKQRYKEMLNYTWWVLFYTTNDARQNSYDVQCCFSPDFQILTIFLCNSNDYSTTFGPAELSVHRFDSLASEILRLRHYRQPCFQPCYEWRNPLLL